MNWYLDVLRNNYANFAGRARRKEYWMFALFNAIVVVVLEILTGLTAGTVLNGIFATIVILYLLAVVVPGWAVTARRLHDIDRSGWWQLISLVPLVGPIVLFIFTVLDGTPGSNQYGSNPKEPA